MFFQTQLNHWQLSIIFVGRKFYTHEKELFIFNRTNTINYGKFVQQEDRKQGAGQSATSEINNRLWRSAVR